MQSISASRSAMNNWTGSLEAVVRPRNVDPEAERPFLSHSEDTTPCRPAGIEQETKTWSSLLIVSTAAITLGTVIPGGYNVGILNSPQQIIVNFCNASLLYRYGLEVEETPLQLLWSFVVSVFLIGGGLGALFGGPIANCMGRKNALFFNCSLNVVASVLFGTCGLAHSVEMLLLGRLIVGFAAGMSTSFMPVFLVELATPSLRTFLGTLCPIGLTFGLFIGQILSMEKVMGNEDNWNLLLALTSVPALICLATWYWIPESPRHLFVTKQDNEKAIKELCRLRGEPADKLQQEIESLQCEVSSTSADSETSGDNWNLRTIWAKRNLRWPFICVIVLHVGNQFSGINAVFYYSTDIFHSAGLDKEQAEYALLGAGFINFAMSGSVALTTNYFGRRPLMLISTTGVTIFLVVLTAAIYYINEASWVSYACIASLMMYVVFFGLGLGSLPFFLPSELIPAGPRPLVMSLGCMVNWSLNFVIGMTFPSMQSVMGVFVFLIFAVATFILVIFIYFRLPETFQPQRRTLTPT